MHEVIDVTSEDALLIVMELCGGGPIMKMNQGVTVDRMDEDRARSVFRQLVLGLSYLHFNSIVHRDLKPESKPTAHPAISSVYATDLSRMFLVDCLFMSDQATVKLIDFGISKFTNAGTDKLDSQGSPAFMPPELLPGHPETTPDGFACDVWSLGATLYALVAGRLPFDQSDPTEMFRAIKEDSPAFPNGLSSELRVLLTAMLSKDPAARPTLRQLWDDAWVTRGGASPLEPSYDDNCREIVEPSKAEIDESMRALRGSMFLAAKAASKFKGLLTKRRSTSSGLGLDSPPPASPDGDGVIGRDVVMSPAEETGGLISPSRSPSKGTVGGRGVSPMRGLTRMEELKLGEAELGA